MKTYEVTKTVTITAQPGSVVVLQDEQAKLVGEYIKEKKPTAPKNNPNS